LLWHACFRAILAPTLHSGCRRRQPCLLDPSKQPSANCLQCQPVECSPPSQTQE
jgi:hypothetical protein